MNKDTKTLKLLRSIKNGVWMLVALLLLQNGLGLMGLKSTQAAEAMMLLSFWGGLILFTFVFVGVLWDWSATQESGDSKSGEDPS